MVREDNTKQGKEEPKQQKEKSSSHSRRKLVSLRQKLTMHTHSSLFWFFFSLFSHYFFPVNSSLTLSSLNEERDAKSIPLEGWIPSEARPLDHMQELLAM